MTYQSKEMQLPHVHTAKIKLNIWISMLNFSFEGEYVC